jgi:hypothetical protein
MWNIIDCIFLQIYYCQWYYSHSELVEKGDERWTSAVLIFLESVSPFPWLRFDLVFPREYPIHKHDVPSGVWRYRGQEPTGSLQELLEEGKSWSWVTKSDLPAPVRATISYSMFRPVGLSGYRYGTRTSGTLVGWYPSWRHAVVSCRQLSSSSASLVVRDTVLYSLSPKKIPCRHQVLVVKAQSKLSDEIQWFTHSF